MAKALSKQQADIMRWFWSREFDFREPACTDKGSALESSCRRLVHKGKLEFVKEEDGKVWFKLRCP